MILKTLEFRHCETSQRLGVAIHESKIDCHESANADSRNDDSFTFPNDKIVAQWVWGGGG